jgi:hypothetical protein
MAVRVAEGFLDRWTCTLGAPAFVKQFDLHVEDCREGVLLYFDIVGPISPKLAGCGEDPRCLGLGLESLEIERLQ